MRFGANANKRIFEFIIQSQIIFFLLLFTLAINLVTAWRKNRAEINQYKQREKSNLLMKKGCELDGLSTFV